jgi:hypothetical protein
MLMEGEEAIAHGKRTEAEAIFTRIKEGTTSGLFHVSAVQYLGLLKFQEGQKDSAYQLLQSIVSELGEDAKCVLHSLAADHSNWDLVSKLSSDCFQFAPSQEIALRNARAFAYLKQPKPAGGWLQTAVSQGPLDVKKILNEDPFQAIKHEPDFDYFVKRFT